MADKEDALEVARFLYEDNNIGRREYNHDGYISTLEWGSSFSYRSASISREQLPRFTWITPRVTGSGLSWGDIEAPWHSITRPKKKKKRVKSSRDQSKHGNSFQDRLTQADEARQKLCDSYIGVRNVYESIAAEL